MLRFPHAEEAIRALAARQHGVVSRAQLLSAGVSPDAVDGRLERGQLRPLHRGIYLVGPIAPPRAREMAAHLACGPSAVVSHGSAAAIWGLTPPLDPSAAIDVIVRGGQRRSRRGIRVRRVPTVRAAEVTTIEGIPVTTPPRTLSDLAHSGPPRVLERALAEAYALRLVTPEGLRKLLTREKGRKGSCALRSFLGGSAPAWTRSEAEARFLALVRRGRLPEPQANVVVRGYEVDFLWRSERLVVEVDGFAFHSSARSFELDRRRDAVLTGAGLRVVRVTWRQIASEPDAVLVRLAQALAVRP
ncbi:MAG TPA: type IV toxin-antitoxin system AbiEi family antitoxin domain-containing protein [Longimicrobiales bacterium]|nr:type IV toxin-antitoxin system AbiEi family antitoxin domain-containing protein [Longimicrobiales bacterium]